MRILVVGAAGFVGSAVARAAAALPGVRVRTWARREKGVAGDDHFRGDLLDPAAAAAAVRDVTSVVHCAHAGPEAVDPRAVCDTGTRLLCAAATAAGVRRIVVVSTTAVYGWGPHVHVTEAEIVRRPRSALSEARKVAEDVVLAHGGIVARAPLTLGVGDRWVLPAAMRLQSALGWIDGGAARQSVVHVDDLARATLGLLDAGRPASAYHVAHPEPASVRALLEAVARPLRIPLHDSGVTSAVARSRIDPRLFDLAAVEHTYNSSAAWNTLGWRPSRSPLELDAADLDWYASMLRSSS